MRRTIATMTVFLAVALLLLGSGDMKPLPARTIIITLRDHAVIGDVESLQALIIAEGHVERFEYRSQHSAPTPEAAAANPPDVIDGDESPFETQWFFVRLYPGTADPQVEALVDAVESHPAFSRTVYVPGDGEWWHYQD